MKSILVVESSPSGEKSVTRRLTRELVAELKARWPKAVVTTRDLAERPLPHLSAETVAALFTPAEKRDAEQRELARASEQAVDELLAADAVVIGAPMWNFGVPSSLKAWIDHVSRAGRTFRYTPEGPVGLAGGRTVFVATSSGGVYSQGEGRARDFVAPYLRAVLGFLGMSDVRVARAEGVSIPGLMEGAFEKARLSAQALFEARAAA